MAQLQTTAVTGSLTVTGQITAQTLNVQQVTSSIVYSSGSNRFGNLVTDVQQMTGSLRVTGSGIHYIVGGSVGIGTVLPSYRVQIDSPSGDWGLHVKGVSTTNSSYGMFIDAGTSTSDAAFMVRSADTTTTFFRIIGNGNIGIGTTSPNAAFNIVTPAADTTGDAFVFKGSNGKEFVSINKLGFIRSRASDTNGANMHFIDNTGNKRMEMGINSTIMSWYSDALASTFMVFQHSSGNIGIGTTAPSQLVEAYKSSNGDIVYQVTNPNTGTSATAQFFASNGTTRSQFFHTGTSYTGTGILSAASNLGGIYNNQRGIALIAASATGSILFSTNTSNAERMRIASDGNVGIGTTSPAARLQISGSSNVLNVVGSGSLSTSSLFSVDGAFGRLFEVTDDLSNSLFSVNTIAGLPVIEAFADYSVNLGTYSAASGSTMRITGSSVGIGTTNPAMNLQIDSTGFSFRLRERSDGSSLVISGNQIQARTSANGGSALYLNYTNGGEIYTGTGNVGIGTTSTSRKLTIWQTLDGNYGQYIYHGGTNGSSYGLLIDAGATSVDAGLRVRSKAGTDYFIIKGDGNVGIGTTLPSRVLYVSSSVWDNTAGAGVIFDNSNTVGAGLTLKPNASVVTNGSSGWAMYAGGPGAAIGDGNLGFWAHGTNQARLLIQRDGNVGIGTTTTANTLHVHGTSDGLGYIRITDSVTGATSTDGVRIGYNSGVLRLQNYENSDIQFLTNNTTEAIRIKSDGNLGIGTTSPVSRLNLSDGASMYAAATGEMLQIKRNVTNGTDAGQVRLTLGNNSNTFAIVYGGTTDRLRFIDGGLTEILSLVNGGNVGIGSIAPDARLTVSASSGDLATFYTGATKRLTITTGGELSFNTSFSSGLVWSPASLRFEGQTVGITARPFASNYVSFTVAGATGQTANLQTWQSQAGTVYSVVDANGDFAIQATASIGKLQLGSDWKVNPDATNTIYLSSTGFSNVNIAPEIIVTSNTSATTPGGTIGLALHNTNVTAGAFSPLLVFSKRETGSSDYNAAIAAIGARTVTGTGNANDWIDGDLMFYTAPTAGSGLVERMRIIQDGNIGIATTTPLYKLQIGSRTSTSTATPDILSLGGTFSNSAGSNIKLRVYDDSGGSVGGMSVSSGQLEVNTWAASKIAFYRGTTQSMIIDGNGNLGIGTTAPTRPLQISRTAAVAPIINLNTTDSTSNGTIIWTNSAGTQTTAIGTNYNVSDTGAIEFISGSATNMILRSSGNLGIGTTVPSYKLHTAGNAYISDTLIIDGGGNTLTLRKGSGNAAIAFAGTSDQASFLIEGVAGGGMQLYTSAGGTLGTPGWTSRMYVSSSGNVGIGTTAPAVTLQVDATSGGIVRVTRTSVGSGYAQLESDGTNGSLTVNNSLYVYAGGSARMFVSSSGNVGIGTTNPSLATLQVGSTSVNSNIAVLGSSTSGIEFRTNSAGGVIASLSQFFGNEGALQLYDTTTLKVLFRASGSSYINSTTGNFGIGTTSPTAKLDVNGDAIFGAQTKLKTYSDVSSSGIFDGATLGANNFFYWNGGRAFFGTNGAERMRILSDGNVGIGTTAPLGILHANGGDSYFGSEANVATSIIFRRNAATRGSIGTYNSQLEFSGGSTLGAGHMVITSIGDVGIGTTSPSTFGGGGLTLGSTSTGKNLIINSSNAGNNGLIQFIDTAGNSALQIAGTTTQAFLYSYGTRSMGFYTNNVERVRIDSSGNVGIGSTAPTQKLDVVGAIKTTSNLLLPSDGMIDWGSGDARIVEGEVTNYSLSFKLYDPVGVAVSTRLFMSSSGNVGIGTTSPAYRLDIVQGGTLAFGAKPFGDNNTNYNRLFEPAGNIAIYLGNASDPANYYDNTSHYLRSRTGTTTYAFINTNGSVGLGTTSPTARLHVQGTTVISGSLNLSGSAVGLPEHMVIALSDETTTITTGTAKVTMRAPFAMTLTDLPRASLSTASTSGLVTVDINEAGTSVLGANKLSIDANELTSTTAATPTTIADALIADDAQITFDIDGAGTGAKGLKVTLYYIRT